MQQRAFESLHDIERTWWYQGRVAAVEAALSSVSIPPEGLLLDVGAGFGSMYPVLAKHGKYVHALEPHLPGRVACEEKGYAAVFSSLTSIPPTLFYSLIGAFDVLEHIEDDAAFVRSLYNATAPGGVLVATVPAFQFLWSAHDIEHQHFRRHTRKSLRLLLSQAGFHISYIRHWNIILFPLAVLLRCLSSGGEKFLRPHPLIEAALRTVVVHEPRLSTVVPVPFGLSIVVVATKRAE